MLINGNALDALKTLDAESVQTCVTSPPYWGLRDYGVEGQLGLEKTPQEYVDRLVEIFREVKRVLRNDGTLWLNLGDSYAGGNGRWGGDNRLSVKQATNKGCINQEAFPIPASCKPKDLVGIPWMVAFALRADGWYLRSDIIWSKPNPMPESVTDRPTKAHEYIFLLTKSSRYYYDADAIKEPIAESSIQRINQPNFENQTGGEKDYRNGTNPNRSARQALENFAATAGRERGRPNGAATFEKFGRNTSCGTPSTGTRNSRSVWHVATRPYKEAHFATFPEKLIEPCVLAGAPVGSVVLDPFAGSGTTGAVALKHGRKFIGIELNPAYVEMAQRRIRQAAPLFEAVA